MRNHHTKSEDTHMTKTRTLLIAAALTLAGTMATTATANAAPVPCTTKRCVPPPPRTCTDVQSEIDGINATLTGRYTGWQGLYYSLAMGIFWADNYATRSAVASNEHDKAVQTLAAVIANAPVYASEASGTTTSPTFGILTLDRQALWEMELANAQAEVSRLANDVAQLTAQANSLAAGIPVLTQQIGQLEAQRSALQTELKSCIS
jgi:hypothetical protein